MRSSYLAKSTERLLFISWWTKNTTIYNIYLNSKSIANSLNRVFETDLTSLKELLNQSWIFISRHQTFEFLQFKWKFSSWS